jgi:SAM-dependent methyltransferase
VAKPVNDEMRRFWDERAREDAFYFVDNRLRYRQPDRERFWEGGREDLDRMLDLLGARIDPRDRIVEIGCGLGRITRALAKRGRDVRALDVSAEMLEMARGHNHDLANVEWIAGDGRSLAPIEAESADACQSQVVFQHIPDPEITLGYVSEMGRVLKSGGWAAFQVSNAPALHRRRGLVERTRTFVLSRIGRAPRGQSHPAWLGSSIDLGRLERAAAEAGMEIERVTGEGTQMCLVLLRKSPAQAPPDRR